MNLTLDEILSLADEYEHTLPPVPPPFHVPVGADLAGWIDQTLLKPEATGDEVRSLCAQARELRFASVCVNPSYAPLAAGLLVGCQTRVCAVVAFPFGANLPELKAQETRSLVEKGAAEIDMVINIGALKDEDISLAFQDVQAVVDAAAGRAIVKVILETALLTRREKILGCLAAKAAGADFVKTSTGFGPGGATVEDVALLRRLVGAQMGVKASGGIRTLENAWAMITAGANRLGTSAGASILQAALQGAAA
ncbi:MAG: deoxyribose-phosphate aldolase [Anaerolineales bacterium]